MSEALWQLDQVTLTGHGHDRLSEITVAVHPGVTAVIGPSGAGKTSLLNLLVGYDKPTRGRVTCHIRAGRRMPVFWAPPHEGLWPDQTVERHLSLVVAKRDDSRVRELLDQFDLTARAAAYPASLSAGERARLAVVRALAAEPAVLVLDEPLEHVDELSRRRYWQIVREHLARTSASLVFASHSREAVTRQADHAVYLSEGRVRYAGSMRALYENPPTQELALALGEANWMTPEDAKLWLGQDADSPRAYRPQQVCLQRDEQADVLLEQTERWGAMACSQLRHEPTGRTLSLWHEATSNGLHAGQRVAVRTLALLLATTLALLLIGCGASSAAEPAAMPVQKVNIWPMPPDGASVPAPRSIAIGPTDEVLVLDTAGRVLVFSADGKLQRQWRMPTNEAGNPEGAAFLADGRIAVADTHYHRVVFFDDQGEMLGTLGEFSESGEPLTFIYPVDIEQDEAGYIYIAEYGGNDRVQKLTAEGEFVASFGSVGSGPGQFQRAAGLVWHDRHIYVADAANVKVHVYTDEGEFVRELGAADARGAGLSFEYPYDIAIGPDERLYVVEWGAGRVQRVSLDGERIDSWGSPGVQVGQLRTPWGVGVDSRGRVRIADTENRRIVELIF